MKKLILFSLVVLGFLAGCITFEDRREVLSVTSSTFPNNTLVGLWGNLGVPDLQFEYEE